MESGEELRCLAVLELIRASLETEAAQEHVRGYRPTVAVKVATESSRSDRDTACDRGASDHAGAEANG
jgi:hypothetical protein